MEVNNQCNDKKPPQNDVCRLCMSKNATVPIFPDSNIKIDSDLPLVCKIMSTVNIQVRKDDGLPTCVCGACAEQVGETYEFLRLCEMSDSFLRQYLDFGLRQLQISWLFGNSDILRMLEIRNQWLRLIEEPSDPEEDS